MLVKKVLGSQNTWISKVWSNKIFGLKRLKSQKIGSKKFYQDQIRQMSPLQLASIKYGPGNIPLKFGQNRACNSRDIPHMDKSSQDKRHQDKCHRDSWNLF